MANVGDLKSKAAGTIAGALSTMRDSCNATGGFVNEDAFVAAAEVLQATIKDAPSKEGSPGVELHPCDCTATFALHQRRRFSSATMMKLLERTAYSQPSQLCKTLPVAKLQTRMQYYKSQRPCWLWWLYYQMVPVPSSHKKHWKH